MIFSATYCPYCTQAKAIFSDNDFEFHSVDLDVMPGGTALMDAVSRHTGDDTVPQIFVSGQYLGGYNDLLGVLDRGEWFEWYEPQRYAAALEAFDRLTRRHRVLVFGGPNCPYCAKARQWLEGQDIPYHYTDVETMEGAELGVVASKVSGHQTIPNIFVNGMHLGGYDQLVGERFVSLYAAD
eukprot:EG_transcript_17479